MAYWMCQGIREWKEAEEEETQTNTFNDDNRVIVDVVSVNWIKLKASVHVIGSYWDLLEQLRY